MRRGSPINVKRRDSIGNDAAWIGQHPLKNHAIGLGAAAGQYRSELNTVAQGRFPKARKLAAFRCPSHEARRFKAVQLEGSWSGSGPLLRVGRDDFEISTGPQRYECIVRSPQWVPPAYAGTNPEQ